MTSRKDSLMDTHGERRGILAKKGLWIGVGTSLFILIAFIMPLPLSLVETMEKYGYVQKMIAWDIAHSAEEAAAKTMIVLGIVPMAVVFFAVEALPIGVTGILMPTMAYFFGLLPFNMIGKTFAGDAPMFMLGVFALGATVVEVGYHKRLAVWLLGWTRGFWVPMVVLCISMSIVGSFMSAPAMCSFMVPVLMAVYYGSVTAGNPEAEVVHDPALAKYLLFSLCFALNMGGPGTPSAGGRNVIMMGLFTEYGIPITYSGWMRYGWPLVPLGSVMLLLYMAALFSRKIRTRDLTPGLQRIKEETRRMGKMKYPEYVTAGTLLLIVILWIFGGEATGLGGPALLALVIPVLFKSVRFERIVERISFNAWFMYCGALTLGALLRGAAVLCGWLQLFWMGFRRLAWIAASGCGLACLSSPALSLISCLMQPLLPSSALLSFPWGL